MFNFRNERYNRQVNMPEWGEARQARLKGAHVAVIGAGGVKSSLLLCLAAGGIGRIDIIEFDRVELSNLNRQILYGTKDIGKLKGAAAQATLRELNPEIDVHFHNARVDEGNVDRLLAGCSLIVEGGDSPDGRNLINRYCLSSEKPMVHCSAQFSYGYVFSMIPRQRTACFACAFPNDRERKTSTGPVPVNGLSTMLAGTLGAAEVFKWFLGYEDFMSINRKKCFNSLLMVGDFEDEECPRNPSCSVCSIHYR